MFVFFSTLFVVDVVLFFISLFGCVFVSGNGNGYTCFTRFTASDIIFVVVVVIVGVCSSLFTLHLSLSLSLTAQTLQWSFFFPNRISLDMPLRENFLCSLVIGMATMVRGMFSSVFGG